MELAKFVKVLSIIVKGQNAYGRKHNLEDMISYFGLKLSKRYTVDQVIYALDIFTDKYDDIPTPSDVIKILNPEKPKITEAQFVEAQKWQERNGYPIFSDARDVIDQYRKQNEEMKANYEVECDNVSLLVDGSIKKLDHLTQKP